MDEHNETTGSSIVPLSPLVSLELLQRKLAEFYAEFYGRLQAKVQAQIAEDFTKAFEEIDRAIDKALVIPLQPGARAEEVAAVVKQAAVVKKAVKEPLRRRLAEFLAENSRTGQVRAEFARHEMPRPQILTNSVVTPIVTSGPPPDPPKERKMVLLNNKM